MIELSLGQRDALKKIRNGSVLNGGVGSGKSRTALAYYYISHGGSIRPENDEWVELATKMRFPRDLYIITTAKKRDTLEWEGEMIPFGLYTKPETNSYGNKVVVDSWNNIGKYKDVRGSFFIFDEQRVVGSGAWVKSFLKIAAYNEWILLSATPGDTWEDYIPVFIANGFYRNRTEFKDKHIVYRPFTKFPQIERWLGVDRLVRLRDRILVDIPVERRTVRHDEFVFTDYDKFAYRDILKLRWNPWTNMPIETPGELCQCLRRVVSDTDSRQVALMELFEEHPRMIVFYNFDYERDLILNLGYGDRVEVAEWSGHKHQPVPESYKWVYLVQYNAGSEGWNCIKTDTIVFYSENYSYKMMEQAAGRIDRMNTMYTDLWYYHLTSNSSIERAVRRSLTNKKQFNETRFVSKLKLGEPKKYA